MLFSSAAALTQLTHFLTIFMLVNTGQQSGIELPISRLIRQRIKGQKIKYIFLLLLACFFSLGSIS